MCHLCINLFYYMTFKITVNNSFLHEDFVNLSNFGVLIVPNVFQEVKQNVSKFGYIEITGGQTNITPSDKKYYLYQQLTNFI